jgi:hypothetical protein
MHCRETVVVDSGLMHLALPTFPSPSFPYHSK